MTLAAYIVEIVFAVMYFCFGFSHIFQRRMWVRFFVRLRAMGRKGNQINALMVLVPGCVIVALHNVWSGLPIVLTIIGWAHVIKGVLFILFPALGLRSIGLVREDRAHYFIVAGIIMLIMGALLTWSVLITDLS